MLPETLVGLACLIVNGEPVDKAIVNTMTENEIEIVRELTQTESCLPQDIERLLAETKEKLESGGLIILAGGQHPAPTVESF